MAEDAEANQQTVELDDGRRLLIRPAGAADADALKRLSSPAHLVAGPGDMQRSSPGSGSEGVFIAATSDQRIVGVVWLELDTPRAGQGRLGMTLDPRIRHLGAEAALAKRAAEYARVRGCRGVIAHVPHISSDVLASFRAAGMTVASCVSFGGTAEIDLRV